MKKPVLYLLIILLAFSSCSRKDDNSGNNNGAIVCDCDYRPTGWDYPVCYNEFYALGSLERIAVIRIPEEVLDTLSPEDVVRLFVTWPYMGMIAGRDLLHGLPGYYDLASNFEAIQRTCSILSRMKLRDDIGGLLVAAYKDIGESGFKTLPYCKNEHAWPCMPQWLQFVLSQKEILQNMTHDERLELMIEAKSRASYGGDYHVMVAILEVEEYPELMAHPNREVIIDFFWIEYFMWVKLHGITDYDYMWIYDEVNKLTENFINDNKK